MKTIGIKLADGSFYPVLEEGTPKQKNLELTTAHNNQTKVMVDLYRSTTCTMEDAEYVDSLQIENLNAHPTGETEISFTVALDEDNQLSAHIIDEETGKESGTTITLVSRTLEERLVTDEYKLADHGIKPKKTGGLLAAASKLRDSDDVENEMGEPDIEETAVDPQNFEDFNLGDPDVATTSEEDLDDVLGDMGQPTIDAEPLTAEDFNLENNDLPDFNLDNLEANSETAEETEENSDLPDFDLEQQENAESSEPTIESDELPDFDLDQNENTDNSEVTIETNDLPNFSEENTDLPDFNFDDSVSTENSETAEITESENLDSFDALGFEAPTESETTETTDFFNSDSTEITESSESDSLDLPDFDLEQQENAESSEPTIESDELPDFDLEQNENTDNSEVTIETNDLPDFSEENADLPDFNFDDFASTENSETAEETDSLGLFETTETTAGDFDLPDFGDISSDTSLSEEDDLFSDNSNDDIPTGGGISFTGLYDKETELGDSSSYTDEETVKKTRVPVIICIICAIICVIATALILFIIPSKYNLINKKAEKEQPTEIVQEEVQPEPIIEESVEPEPEPVPEAKEDEIVIVEKAEEVVPEQPPVVEEKPKDITYKIKWGDTLWDISNTYYKNPWRYKYIARYNNIKDPDYIVSGTIITIPAE